jgi:O-antigen ligase
LNLARQNQGQFPMTGVLLPRVLKNVTIAAEVLLLGWLFATEDLRGIPLLFGTFVAVIAFGAMVTSKWPRGALLTLILGSVMPRFAWTVGDLHVRPEHLTLGLVILLILWPFRRPEIRPQSIWRPFDVCLLAYIGVNFLTSGLTSPEPHLTLRWALLSAFALSPYFIVRWLVVEEKTLRSVFRMLLIVGVAEAMYGTLCFLSYHLFETKFGVEFGQYGSIPGVFGTQYEANLFGSYSACCAIMCLAGYLFDRRELRRWYLAGVLIALLGTFVSLARAALLASPLAAGLLIWLAVKQGRVRVRGLTLLAAAVIAVLLVISPLVLGIVEERFSTLDLSDVSTDESTARRVVGISAAMSDIRAHPWFGTGANSFRLLFDWNDYWPTPVTAEGELDERGAWIGNTTVRVLHDTGIVGFAVFLAFLSKLVLEVRKVIRDASDSTRVVLIALLAGLALYAITFQVTDATNLSFAWIHIGLLAAATTVASGRKRNTLSVSLS